MRKKRKKILTFKNLITYCIPLRYANIEDFVTIKKIAKYEPNDNYGMITSKRHANNRSLYKVLVFRMSGIYGDYTDLMFSIDEDLIIHDLPEGSLVKMDFISRRVIPIIDEEKR
jgi:hypothetical protein